MDLLYSIFATPFTVRELSTKELSYTYHIDILYVCIYSIYTFTMYIQGTLRRRQ